MKKIQRNTKSLLVLAALTASASAVTITFVGPGNLDSSAAWGGTFPGTGDIGIVDINAAWPSTSGALALSAGGDLIIGSSTATNIILTAAVDVVATLPTSVTFNNVTVNVGDDIFTGGNFIFNVGSVTNVDDDFEANSNGGIITVNGGTHTVGLAPAGGSNFGAQNNSTLNFLGGTVTGVDLFRTTNGGSSLTIGGDATLVGDAGSTVAFFPGTVGFNADWSGSLDVPGVTDWQATLITAGATLDGVAIDATSFGEDFEVTGGALSLVAVVPEPSSLSLLGLSALFLAGRRSRK